MISRRLFADLIEWVEMQNDIVAVVENRPLTGGHFLLGLYSPAQARATRPGQFAMVRLLGHSDVLLRRPMSIYDVVPRASEGRPTSNSSSPAYIRLLYKIVGRGTRLMSELKPGDRVELLAPLGHGFFEEESALRRCCCRRDRLLHRGFASGCFSVEEPATISSASRTSRTMCMGFRLLLKTAQEDIADMSPNPWPSISKSGGTAGFC